jgi:hypothetical protein
MAQIVALLGRGGQRFAETVLGWNRPTIRKGQIELETGIEFIDRFSDRGRKRAEHHLPELLEDIKAIVDPVSQADPTFRSKRLYSPLTAKEIHRRLPIEKGYKAS